MNKAKSTVWLLVMLCGALSLVQAQERKPTPAPTKRPANIQSPTPKPVSKPASPANTAKPAQTGGAKPMPTPAKGADPSGKAITQDAKPELTPEELLEQGKKLYRAAKFQQALTKFDAALKLAPEHDEALALAAETAYRLDNQAQARLWFLRRAGLSNQKPSVKAYSFYRTALSCWRIAHDLVAKSGTLDKEGKVTYKLPEKDAAQAEQQISDGLSFADRALNLSASYAEGHNLKNLLHSEAALLAADEKKAAEKRRLALEALRRALQLAKVNNEAAGGDFNLPTVRISEFALTKEVEDVLEDPLLKLLEGGRPITRVAAAFPSVRPAKTAPTGDSATGVTSGGSAYSLGTGRGALTAAYVPGKVKVEVLVSTTGNVVFAHVVQGRSDLSGAAVIAARKWKFAPAKFEGKPVQVSGVITFDLRPGRARPAATPTPKPQ